MISATIFYPKTADSQFDLDYYLNTHTPLVRDMLTPVGLVSVELEEGLAGGAPDTLPAFTIIARLNFPTIEVLQAALAVHAPSLLADIPNFTDVQPILQISRGV
jgi:uncharacterized protein (TIGR02118 family)